MYLFKKAFFYLSDSDFYIVQGENGLMDQVLLLRVKYSDKGVSLIISLAWSEDYIKVKL